MGHHLVQPKAILEAPHCIEPRYDQPRLDDVDMPMPCNTTCAWRDDAGEKERGRDAHASTCLGVSENSVPLNPMVNDHYPY